MPAIAPVESTSGMRLRRVSPAIYAGVVLAFLLPFATVSCSESATKTTTTSFSGLQLATHSVPTAYVYSVSKAGRTRLEPSGQLSADVESRASAFALLVLLTGIVGVLIGAVELAGIPARLASRTSLAIAVLALGTMAFLGLRAVASIDADVTLRSGFWVVSGLLGTIVALEVNAWRTRGGRLRDLLDDRFAAGMLVAIPWTFSFWLLFLIDITSVDLPIGVVGTFTTGVVVGICAGVVAPSSRRGRLLLAACGPVVFVLSIWPLTLPLVVLAAFALRRFLFESGTAPSLIHPRFDSARSEAWLRVPRTQAVMLAGVGGLLLGPAIVYADAFTWGHSTHVFVKNGPFQLWTAIMGAQTLLWTFAAPILLGSLRRQLRHRASLMREVVPSAAVLVVLVIAFVVVPALTGQFPSFIPHLHFKVRLITAGATILAVVASASIWLIRGRLEQLSEAPADDATIESYLSLRRELDRLLAFLGAVVGLAVLGTAELRHTLLLYAKEPGVRDFTFPAESVLLYGFILSFVLALVYVPTYVTCHQVGARLRDALVPFPRLDGLAQSVEQRRLLDDVLGLKISASTSFKIASAILSPLASSVVGILPSLTS